MRLFLVPILLMIATFPPTFAGDTSCMTFEGKYDSGNITVTADWSHTSCPSQKCTVLITRFNRLMGKFKMGCDALPSPLGKDECKTSAKLNEYGCSCDQYNCLGNAFISEAVDTFVRTGELSLDPSNCNLNGMGHAKRDIGKIGCTDRGNLPDNGTPGGQNTGNGNTGDVLPQGTSGGGNADGYQPTSPGSTSGFVLFTVAALVLVMRCST